MWTPNPPKLILLLPVFPRLAPMLAKGFDVADAPNVKGPEGSAGLKLRFEGCWGGKEALRAKLDAPVVVLLPKGVEN